MPEFPDSRLHYTEAKARPEGFHVVITHDNPDDGESLYHQMYVKSEYSAFIRFLLALNNCATFADSKRLFQYTPKDEETSDQIAKIVDEQGIERMEIQSVSVCYSDGSHEYMVYLKEPVEDILDL